MPPNEFHVSLPPLQEMALDDLLPREDNPRRITDWEMDQLKNSLDRWSYLQPIVWNKRTQRIVGGHQRAKALRLLGKKTVDVAIVDLPVEEETALMIALNRIGGDWEYEQLSKVMRSLDAHPETQYLLPMTGFTQEERAPLLDTTATYVPAPAPARTRRAHARVQAAQEVTCPSCGHIFAPGEEESPDEEPALDEAPDVYQQE